MFRAVTDDLEGIKDTNAFWWLSMENLAEGYYQTTIPDDHGILLRLVATL